jgi:predicted  nucleic acid-binding Zn-ribbon protein
MAEKQFGNSGRREITPGQTPQGERGAGAINDRRKRLEELLRGIKNKVLTTVEIARFKIEIAKFKKEITGFEKEIAELERRIAELEKGTTGLETQARRLFETQVQILLKRIRSQTDEEK